MTCRWHVAGVPRNECIEFWGFPSKPRLTEERSAATRIESLCPAKQETVDGYHPIDLLFLRNEKSKSKLCKVDSIFLKPIEKRRKKVYNILRESER